MQTTAQCIYDTFVKGGTFWRDCYESETYMEVCEKPTARAVMQFHLPDISEINITSAKLYFHVTIGGGNAIHEVTLHDCITPLNGLTDKEFESRAGATILSATETLTFSTADLGVNYNRWFAIDITNLVIGHMGEQHFTISMRQERINATGIYRWTRINSIESGNTPYILIEYEYATPFIPTLIFPIGDAISNTGNVTFQWKYNTGSGKPQKKYEFGWKMQSSTRWNTEAIETPNTFHVMNATVFHNGIVDWRVRCYNENHMVSEYAQGQFLVIGKPGNPTISGIKNDAITEIIWNANKYEETTVNVNLYQNGKLIHESGNLPGGIEDIYRPNIILDNGNYSVTIKIANLYGMWSDPISKAFTINREQPQKPLIQTANGGNYIKVAVQGNASRYILYRSENSKDYIPIAWFQGMYDDYSIQSGVLYSYFVRAYNGGYTDSKISDVFACYDGYYLSLVDDMKNAIHLIHHDSEVYLPVSQKPQNQNSYIQYIGRTYPVKEAGTFKAFTISLEAFLDMAEVQRLNELLSRNGIYCLRNNESIMYCDIKSLSATKVNILSGYRIQLELEQIDYRSEVKLNG